MVKGKLGAESGQVGCWKSNERGSAGLRWPFAVHPHAGGENVWHDSAAIVGITTFSILYRIEWVETPT